MWAVPPASCLTFARAQWRQVDREPQRSIGWPLACTMADTMAGVDLWLVLAAARAVAATVIVFALMLVLL